ncbi:kinase [Halobacillus sp. H74]|uniref:kinase n=1 Tax=Halobacillus sp. H74 TaxID=3457436 RepID=UPI003FCC8E63
MKGWSNFWGSLPHLQKGERFIVGIDGLSRAGKTTIVKELGEQLCGRYDVHTFHIDDYIVSKSRRYHTGQEEWFEYYQLQWDVLWLRNHFFELLKMEREFKLHKYTASLDCCEWQNVTLPDTCVVLIEGIFLQREEWREFFDYVIYLDCPREKRFAREKVATRKKEAKFERRYWKAEDYYLQTIYPEKKADLVLQV